MQKAMLGKRAPAEPRAMVSRTFPTVEVTHAFGSLEVLAQNSSSKRGKGRVVAGGRVE